LEQLAGMDDGEVECQDCTRLNSILADVYGTKAATPPVAVTHPQGACAGVFANIEKIY
jgi:hypothetical protein